MVKHPELKEYRKGGIYQNNVLPVWAAFSYFEMVGMTSSVVIQDNRDNADVLPNNTNLYSRLYALKKVLPKNDADQLSAELKRLISKTRVDVYRMNILPADWENLYDRVLSL